MGHVLHFFISAIRNWHALDWDSEERIAKRKTVDKRGAPHRERQPLLQEFFFHLCGANDFLAQEVNDCRKLGLSDQNVNVSAVCSKLVAINPKDPIRAILRQLHPTTQNKPLPTDPYSEEGSHFRILVFRNFVSHIRHSPLNINVYVASPHPSSAYFFLDPRLPHMPKDQRTPSTREALKELELFFGPGHVQVQLGLERAGNFGFLDI